PCSSSARKPRLSSKTRRRCSLAATRAPFHTGSRSARLVTDLVCVLIWCRAHCDTSLIHSGHAQPITNKPPAREDLPAMQRKLHPLEGIVAVFALFFVLALAIGFAQAGEAKAHKTVYLRSSSALVLDADTGEIVIDKNADAVTPIASIT